MAATAAAAISALLSRVFPPSPGQTEDNPLELKAVPGLTTFLDQALFRSNEGQLTATICSSHALLACWLDIKRQSQLLLEALLESHEEESSSSSSSSIRTLCESFARQCLDCSMDAIERLGTDRLAQSANLTDPYDSLSSQGGAHHGTGNVFHGVGPQGIASGIMDAKEETCRRAPMQRRSDCWESPRLFCPDHVWADDSFSACQRWIRNLAKHPFVVKEADALSPLTTTSGTKEEGGATLGKRLLGGSSQRHASLLIQLIQEDLPIRLFHFKQAMEADAVTTKRLYLVKSEYRAPFRAFLEAHQTLLRAPPMEIVQSCLQSRSKSEDPGKELQTLLKTPALMEVLALEREMEQLEQAIGEALYPFTELARNLDQRKARLKVIPGVLEDHQIMALQKTLRRLKCILCRKGAYGTSTGIRPILLDLRNFPRDDELPRNAESDFIANENLASSIDDFVGKLECLSTLVKRKNGFVVVKGHRSQPSNPQQQQDYSVDFPAIIVKGCTESFDRELLQCQLVDWFAMVERQHVLQRENASLPDQIRRAEMAMSIAGAQEQSLKLVQERLEKMQADRQLRFDVLKELLEDMCLREMNLYVHVSSPDPTQSLVLKQTSALGFLGLPLQIAGELLPLG